MAKGKPASRETKGWLKPGTMPAHGKTINENIAAKQSKAEMEAELADMMAECYHDPLKHVMISYPWDSDPSIQLVKLPEKYRARFPNCEYGPDLWACEFLDQIGAETLKRNFDGHTAVDPLKMATASGHGIGKSTLVAWIIKWIMDTRPFCKGTVTANTDSQLRTKTWAELGKWHGMSLTYHWFTYASSRGNMSLRTTQVDPLTGKPYEGRWFCTAQTSREENTEAFAGQHAGDSTSFFVFDEASGISNGPFEVREGGLTEGEPMVFDFGNPTKNSGAFFENCKGRFSHNYIVRSIDSRSVSMQKDSKLHAQWLADYGIDSDFVKVRMLGLFPSAGSLQFIPTELVREAQMRPLPPQNKNDGVVLGVDIAHRNDDEFVIYPRVGMDARSWPIRRFRGLDPPQVVAEISKCMREFEALGMKVLAVFVDMGNTGHAVVSYLEKLGYGNIFGIWFGGGANDKRTYRAKGDEMWGIAKDAMALKGLCLPPDNEPSGHDLKQQLTQREFGYTLLSDKIQLESKADMKERLGAELGSSPDIADALVLTFAMDVATLPQSLMGHNGGPSMSATSDYDPLNPTF